VGDIAYKRSLLILEPASIATKKHKKKQPQKGAKGKNIERPPLFYSAVLFMCLMRLFVG
jgi:hypothetical protein